MKIRKNKRKTKKRKITGRLIKIILFITIGIALALALVHTLIDLFSRDIFDLLIEHLEKKSGSTYLVQYDAVDIDFFHRKIVVSNLSIKPDPAAAAAAGKPGNKPVKMLIDGFIPFLELDGIACFKLVFQGQFEADKLKLRGGNWSIYRSIKSGDKRLLFRSTGAAILLSRVKTGPYFFFESGEIILKEPTLFPPAGFYAHKAGRLRFTGSKSSASLSLYEMESRPRSREHRSAKERRQRAGWMSLKIDNLTCSGIDLKRLLQERRFYCRAASIKHPRLIIFKDRRVQPIPRKAAGKFPQQWLRWLHELKIKIKIGKLDISQGRLDYNEQKINEKKTGILFFTNLQAEITNISNSPQVSVKNPSMSVTAEARVMDKGLLKIKLATPINHKKNAFTLTGSLGEMDMRAFNAILAPNVHVRIDRGILDEMQFSVAGDNYSAGGKMRFLYRDLKVSLLKVAESGAHRKRGVPSFLTNIMIRSNNPRPGKFIKEGVIHFTREKPLSFFSYIGQVLLSGVKSVIAY